MKEWDTYKGFLFQNFVLDHYFETTGDSVTFAHNIAVNVNLTQSSPAPLIDACSNK